MAAVPRSFGQSWHAQRNDRFDPVSLWERLGKDRELLAELVDIFVLEGPSMLHKIETALDHHDLDGLSKASHRLKGSVMQLSAPYATAKAAELETLGRNNSLIGSHKLFQELQIEVGWLIKTLKTMVETGPV